MEHEVRDGRVYGGHAQVDPASERRDGHGGELVRVEQQHALSSLGPVNEERGRLALGRDLTLPWKSSCHFSFPRSSDIWHRCQEITGAVLAVTEQSAGGWR